MKKLTGILFVLILAVLLSGCSKVLIKSDADPNVDLGKLQTFYVQKFEPDKRGLEKVIAAKLEKLGFKATSGEKEAAPGQVDALVTYKDKWMWDLTNYMMEIVISFRNLETKYVFATGSSYRTSLARKPPEEMIDEALRELFSR